MALPPPIAAPGTLTVLDITKYFSAKSGGIRTYLLAKAAYVQQRPTLRQVLVVPGAEDALSEAGGVRCYRLRGPRIPFDPSYRFLLATRTTRRLVEHERPDLIEVGSPWFVPWVVRRANRRLAAPTVWFYHTHFPAIIGSGRPGAPAWRRQAGQAAWTYARQLAIRHRAVLVASDCIAGELEREGVANVIRIRLGVDLDTFHPWRKARRQEVRARIGLTDGPVAIYAGRFTEEKQLETALAAWPAVARETGAQLVLVGAGPREARLRASAPPGVTWVPYLADRDQLADLLAASDIYLAPGAVETFGLSALEAMASGTPVLSVDAGGCSDHVRHSGAGALFSPGDAGSLAAAATGLLGSDLETAGRTARGYAEGRHAWPDALDSIFAAYRQVLGRA
ncbi:MAG: glycosyltransferase [Gemmatimonadota bacterium]|nr:glycosyltransferase [Gemmatimonadota bacterium]MDH5283341.1 glycosyltransferase [Gemmatimonadota bacterium]